LLARQTLSKSLYLKFILPDSTLEVSSSMTKTKMAFTAIEMGGLEVMGCQ